MRRNRRKRWPPYPIWPRNLRVGMTVRYQDNGTVKRGVIKMVGVTTVQFQDGTLRFMSDISEDRD